MPMKMEEEVAAWRAMGSAVIGLGGEGVA